MGYKSIIVVALLLLASSIALGTEQKKPKPFYNDYAFVLRNYVNKSGMVNYKKLKAEPQKLQTFVSSVNTFQQDSYEK